MPRNHCRGFENGQCVKHFGHQAIETGEHKPIDVPEDKPLWGLAPQHIKLMTKDENFSVQRSAGLEQPGHNAPNQPAEIAHRIDYHPICRRPSVLLGFR